MAEKMINVGRIIAAHGIKGQVKIEVLSDNPLRFLKGQLLFLPKIGKEMKISSVQEHNGFLLLGFEGVNDRNDAEALKDSLLQADIATVPSLPDGQYYYFQIEGMDVFDYDNGQALGKVAEVLEYTANDVFLIKREGKKDLLLPALKSVIKVLDIKNKRMEVKIPEGLED